MKKFEKVLVYLFVLVIISAIGTAVYVGVKEIPITSLNPLKKSKKESHETDFNINLIQAVNNSYQENYLISPYSIEIALNMLKDGSNGNTYKEIEEVVGSRDINKVNDDVKLANAMFIKDMYKKDIKDEYYSLIKTNYDGEIIYDRFETPDVINNWASEKTDGMIKNVLDNIDSDFVLGLANAIAIDVRWQKSFECFNTESEEFTKIDGTKYNVEMMHDIYDYKNYQYFELADAKGVVLPYRSNKDEHLEFVGILPKDNVSDYLNSLTKEKLESIDSNLKEASDSVHISLSLPRFSYDFDLNEFMNVLESMGIKDAFDPQRANFTNMSSTLPLHVSIAVHKTFIDLNEAGTKAAAVTFFGMDKSAAIVERKKPTIIEIVFNKPFAYMIRDSKTKEILFFGVTYEPNEWQGSTCEGLED